jgi:hypothetical protein
MRTQPEAVLDEVKSPGNFESRDPKPKRPTSASKRYAIANARRRLGEPRRL